MPKDLKDFPRPPGDNGRGLYGIAAPDWSGGTEGYDYWINELAAMGVKWFKVLDAGGASLPLCEKLLAVGIFPIVRIIRKDPPPNDTPEPNPGHIGSAEEETIQRLIAVGVRYFETNNEPNVSAEWKHGAMPADPLEAAKLVALNWLFDARLILNAGGYPGLPAISAGDNMDLMGALVALGRQSILLDGCWIALHNYCLNHPLDYPDDAVNRHGQPLTPEQYAQGVYTQWAWWNNAAGRADTLDEINAIRAADQSPTETIQYDHACFREFEYYNALAMQYLGRSIPIISTEGGFRVGRREDPRYPRVTPEAHRDQTVALFDYLQRQAPDYYFAAVPSVWLESAGREADAWRSSFWQRALKEGADGRNGIPTMAVANVTLGDHLPVIDAVKAMPNLARRLPGVQPIPPIQPSITIQPVKPAPPAPVVPLEEEKKVEVERPGLAVLLSEVPLPPTPSAPTLPPQPIAATEPSVAPAEPSPPPVLPSVPAPVVEPAVAIEPSAAPASPTPALLAEPAATREPMAEPVAAPEPRAAPVAPPALPIKPPKMPVGEEELEWDFRLDALGLTMTPADVAPGESYWKLARAVYEGPNESGGTHHIYYTVLDEHNEPVANQRVWQGWANDKTHAMTNERGQTNIGLWLSYAPDRGESGPYYAWVDELPSDCVYGMGLPLRQHVNFLLTWKRAVR